jgi:hypothetical protein
MFVIFGMIIQAFDQQLGQTGALQRRQAEGFLNY